MERAKTVETIGTAVRRVLVVRAASGSRSTSPCDLPIDLLAAAGAIQAFEPLHRSFDLRVALRDEALSDESLRAADRAGDPELDSTDVFVIGTTESGESGLASLVETGTRIDARHGPGAVRIALLGTAFDGTSVEVGAAAEGLLRHRAADLVVRGEPDDTLPRVLDALFSAEANPTDAPDALAGAALAGTSWRDQNGDVHHRPRARSPQHPATPAWELVDLSAYAAQPRSASRDRTSDATAGTASEAEIQSGPRAWLNARARASAQWLDEGVARGRARFLQRRAGNTATIRTQRTCSPDCPTCHGSFGRQTRERPVGDIVREVRRLVNGHGVRRIVIDDHAFDGQPARAAAIARAIAQIRSAPHLSQLRVEFTHGFRGDGLTDELVSALVALGLKRFNVHIGTASQRLQRLMKSNVHLVRAADGIRRVEAAGATAKLHLYLGLPTETTGEAAHTIRWAARSAATEVAFHRGSEVDLGPHFAAGLAPGEIDDFTALKRRGLRAFYGASIFGAAKRTPRFALEIMRARLA